jgi:hypothetical protein
MGGYGVESDAVGVVGNVLHAVATFHQFRPVPPFGCGEQVVLLSKKNEQGRL